MAYMVSCVSIAQKYLTDGIWKSTINQFIGVEFPFKNSMISKVVRLSKITECFLKN